MAESRILSASYVSPNVRRFIEQQQHGVKIQPPPPFVETPFGRLKTIPWHLGDAGFADPKNFSTPAHIVEAIVDYLVNGVGNHREDTLENKQRVLRLVSRFRDGTLDSADLQRELTGFLIDVNNGLRYSGAYYDRSISDKFVDLIARERKRNGDLCIDPKTDVIWTNSGSEAFDYLIKVLTGGKVLMPKPNFFTYHVVSNFYSALAYGLNLYRRQAVLYNCNLEGMPELEEMRRKVREDPEIKAILVINPNNPTGAVYDKELLLEIIQIAKENGLFIIADQVYNGLTLDTGRAELLHELTSEVPIVEIMSFSKEYLMAGYRLGALVFYNLNDSLMEVRDLVRKLDQQRMSPNIVSCAGGVAALEGSREHVEIMKALFRNRREAFDGINGIKGLKFMPPKAAFYGRIVFEHMQGAEFSRLLLENAAIATIPGDAFAFGDDPMHYNFVRVTLLTDEETIMEGIRRISMLKETGKI